MSTGIDRGRVGIQPPPEPDGVYRPISAMAVLSLVLGTLSLLAFVAPVFWFLPVITLLIAAITSRGLEQARREYAGQLLAQFGIVLSLISLVGAPTRYYTQKVIITNEAQQVADVFLDLILADRVKEAFVHTVFPSERAGMEQQPDNLIVRQGNKYRTFVNENNVVSTLVGKLAEAQVTKVGPVLYGYERGFFEVFIKYIVALPEKEWDVVVKLRGGEAGGREWEGRQWYVETSGALAGDRSNRD